MPSSSPPERRWTILVVPHTSDAPRSFSLTDRSLRVTAWVAGTIALAILCTVAALVLRVRAADRALANVAVSGNLEVDSLRGRLDSLRESITGIQVHASRINASVGVSPSTAATFWSRILARVRSADPSAQTQERRLTALRDSLRREIRGVSLTTDSLAVRASEVSSRAQRLADSVTSPGLRRQ